MKEEQIIHAASEFWELVGRSEPFPRTLESAVAWALPLAIVKVPRLTLGALLKWLKMRGVLFPFQSPDRSLSACLLVRNGRGLVFLDGADPPNEQRFSLAHEISHFLLDYLGRRHRVATLLGDSGLALFDGKRAPTVQERLSAAFSGTELKPFLHLMERAPSGDIALWEVLERESRASRLALELLAPRNVAMAQLAERIQDWSGQPAENAAKLILMEVFGLPEQIAVRYGRALVINRRSYRSFQEWLVGDSKMSNFSLHVGMKK